MKPSLPTLLPGDCLLLLALTVALAGCTMIDYNRAFPKVDWAWSKDAREQRREKAAYKVWADSLATNSPAR